MDDSSRAGLPEAAREPRTICRVGICATRRAKGRDPPRHLAGGRPTCLIPNRLTLKFLGCNLDVIVDKEAIDQLLKDMH